MADACECVYGWTKPSKPIPIGLFLGATADKGLQREGHVLIAVHKCNCGGVIILSSQCVNRAHAHQSVNKEKICFSTHTISSSHLPSGVLYTVHVIIIILGVLQLSAVLCDGPELRGHQPEIVFLDKFQIRSVQWLLRLN